MAVPEPHFLGSLLPEAGTNHCCQMAEFSIK
jgi:hypothetical protein